MAIPQPSNVIEFKLPGKRPKVVEKPAPPEQKKYAVIPFKAILDERLTNGDIRCLALLAAYCNRAGITWVSQNTLAERLKVSRQQISRHMAHLRDCGFVRITHKGWRGERCNTLQVVFDETISVDDAVAITSAQEDTRPPELKERDQKAMQDDNLPELTPEQIEANKRRLASLLATMATQKTGINHQERTMPKQETETVKAIKKRIAEKKPKATPRMTKPVDNSVDNSSPIGNIIGNLEVAQKIKKITIEGLYKVIDLKKTSLGYLQRNMSETDVRWLEHLVNVGTTEDEFTRALESTDRQTVAEVARDLLKAKGLA